MRKYVKEKQVVVDGVGLLKYFRRTAISGTKRGYVEISVEILKQFGLDIYEDHHTVPAVLRIRPIVPSVYGENSLQPASTIEETQAYSEDETGLGCPNCSENALFYDPYIKNYYCSHCGSAFNLMEVEGLRLIHLRQKEPFRTIPTGKLCTIATEGGVGYIHIDSHSNIIGLEVPNEQS